MAERYQGVGVIYLGPPAFGALHLEPEAVCFPCHRYERKGNDSVRPAALWSTDYLDQNLIQRAPPKFTSEAQSNFVR